YPGFADAPGYRTIKTLQANVTTQMTRQAVGDVSSMSWKQLVDDGYVIAGSPDTVTEKMHELITSLRVGNIFCLIHVGDMPQDKCNRSSELFAREVMPRLRNVWPDHAQDDRFWIHPIDQAARAASPTNARAHA
ncbi:MAG: flavin-dependent oxidoreductase, partial [Gammaproteobacteria bacterium]